MALVQTIPSHPPTSRRPVRVHPREHTGRSNVAPRPSRPAGGPPRYRGTGAWLSTAPHRRRPITPMTTVALALLAALITVWLGLVAQFGQTVLGGSGGTTARLPDRLAVVRVQAGETLPQLAARVAPGAPAAQVAERIRDLNGLDSATLAADQTLIAPVG